PPLESFELNTKLPPSIATHHKPQLRATEKKQQQPRRRRTTTSSTTGREVYERGERCTNEDRWKGTGEKLAGERE
ncbi:hypothetical protein SESBI_45163, partial [Sesbania bispinosa]